ncbi:MAG TPA: translocation/assembly module TamB domain-containing protein [Gemmatimonadales bacterium]|jgi:autotransporter translocation and assembly factor TamB
MRVRSIVAAAALTVVGGGSSLLGITGAMLGTEAGRAVLVGSALRELNRRIRGAVTLADVDGSPWQGLTVAGLEVRDPDGQVVLTVGHMELRYGLRDMLSGRLVLGRLALRDVDLNLTQTAPGEPFTLVVTLGSPSPTPGTSPGRPLLLAFRQVTLANARVTIRTPAGPAGSTARVEPGPLGPLRVRTIDAVDARLPFVLVSAPAAPAGPMRFEIASMRAHVSDPAIALHDATGDVDLWPDSVVFALSRVVLPTTEATVHGTVTWPRDTVMLALDGRATRFGTDDLHGLVATLPRGLVGAGVVRVESVAGDELIVDADSLQLEGVGGGGSVSGRLGLHLGPGSRWEQRGTDLRLNHFDLEYVRHLLDTLPIAGRITGHVRAAGPQDRLRLSIDAAFRDSLVPGWPWSEVRGAGTVSVGVPGDFVFHDFRLAQVDLSLASVARLVPAILLVGRVQGEGVLDGPWREARYEGFLRHADLPLPASEATGTLGIDATGELVGLWAALDFDSLRLEGLASTFPKAALRSAVAGRVAVAGLLDSLELDADVSGAVGRVRATGPLFFGDDALGAHRLDVVVGDLDLSVLRLGAATTRMTGAATLAGWWRDSTDLELRAAVGLGPSSLRGAPVDSLVAEVDLHADQLVVDTLRVGGYHWAIHAAGVLGRGATADTRLRFVAETDSLGILEEWVAGVLGPLQATDSLPPSGRLRVAGTLTGAVTAPGIIADVTVAHVRRADLTIAAARGSLSYVGGSRMLDMQAMVGSAFVGRMTVDSLEFRAHGRTDSLGWTGTGRLWKDAYIAAGGSWQRVEDRTRLMVDSASAALVASTWRIGPATATWDETGLTVLGFEAVNDSGVGRIVAGGRLPFRGPGDFSASVESVAIADLWLLLGRGYGSVAGSLGGTFTLRGTARDPVIESMVGLRNASFGMVTAPQMTGVLHYEERRLTGTVEALRLGESILRVEVALPIDLALVGAVRRRLPGPITMVTRADSVDLALLNLVTPQVRRMAGTFDADLGLTGTWEDPQLTGALALRDASAEFPALGVRYENLNGELRLVGDTIHVRSLSLRSGRGTARVQGYVRLEELSRPVLDLAVHAEEFRILDRPDFLTLAASGDVTLTGPAIGATLRGRATVTRGVLYFADLLDKDVLDLDDPLLRDFVDTLEIQQGGLGTTLEVRLLESLRVTGLELEMSRETWLRSREANIQLAGRLTVDRAGDQFVLNGELETPRGSYRLELMPAFNREFTVTRGRVRYFGTTDLNAGLDIEAQHVVRSRRGDPVTVSVHIGGTVYEPKLTLTSDVTPPLSDTEIISYLLFGSPTVQSRQDWLTAQSVADEVVGTLTGELGTALIADWGIPLDYAQIRPSGGGQALGVEGDFGKQFLIFGRPAFLSATPLICTRQTTQFDIGASLEYRLSGRWMLAASIDPARRCQSFASETTLRYQFGLDVFWEIRY